MIIISAIAVPNPGMEEEARAAAMDLETASQDHGTIGYFWSVNQANGSLRVMEVHPDSESIVNHISSSDLRRIAAAVTFKDIEVIGDDLSPAATALLAPFGDYTIWAHLR